jgi:hypothetical protein
MTRHATHTAPEPVTLENVLSEIVALRELVERLVVAPPSPERGWVTVDEAAALIGRTPAAVRKQCRINKIGLKVDGVWRVDRARLVTLKLRDAKPKGAVPLDHGNTSRTQSA